MFADEKWVRECLYPLLDWDRDQYEAKAAWSGLLMNGRILAPLMTEIRRDFHCTASHLMELNEAENEYCVFLTLMVLRRVPGYFPSDFKKVFRALPISALEHCAKTIDNYQTSWLDSDAEKQDKRLAPEQLWFKDVKPFIHDIWR